jgi:hypothetical protein
MEKYIALLKSSLDRQPPAYDAPDGASLLELLFQAYTRFNGIDNAAIRAHFEALYAALNGKPLREVDPIIDAVNSLCWSHEQAGFCEGIRLGFRLAAEMG